MLKPVNQILLPDPRVATTCGRDGMSPLSVTDQHEWVSEVQLSPTVPADIHEGFDRARNAFLYTWFVYELGALAEAQAFACLERALQHRLGQRAAKRDGLSNLIEKAVADGIIQDTSQPPSFAFLLSSRRNDWAHGSVNVHTPAITLHVLKLCADIMNELYV